MSTVLKHPPPSFFAPYPAARPRNSLLILSSGHFRSLLVGETKCRVRTESWGGQTFNGAGAAVVPTKHGSSLGTAWSVCPNLG